MRSEPSAGSEQGPPGAVYLKANFRPQHSGAPPITMMMGFSAQLLNARQCVGLNALKETVESRKTLCLLPRAFSCRRRCICARCVGVSAPRDTSHGRRSDWRPNQFILIPDLFVLSGFPNCSNVTVSFFSSLVSLGRNTNMAPERCSIPV